MEPSSHVVLKGEHKGIRQSPIIIRAGVRGDKGVPAEQGCEVHLKRTTGMLSVVGWGKGTVEGITTAEPVRALNSDGTGTQAVRFIKEGPILGVDAGIWET
jgi:hypothetical protein